MVRTNNGSKFVRVGGKVIRKPTSQSQVKRFERVVNIEQTRLQQEALKQEASKLDKVFLDSTFSTTAEFKQELAKIPKEFSQYMKVNISYVDNLQNARINKINSEIQQSIKDENRYDEKGRKAEGDRRDSYRARESGERARQRALQEQLNRLQKGEIIDVNSILSYANDIARYERDRKEARYQQKAQESKIASELAKGGYNITKIEYKNGKPAFATVDGQRVNVQSLSTSQLKNIRLASSVRAEATKKLEAENQKRLDNLKAEINKATTGTKPDTRKLFNLGFTGNEVTQIVAAYETGASLEKIKNLNVNALFQRLEAGKGRTAVDTTTQTQAFKIGVNQELTAASKTSPNFKPLPFTATVDQFNSQYKNLIAERKKVFDSLTKGVQEQVKKDISINVNSIENKALTGQSMTPKEIQQYNILQIAAGEKLNKAQLNNLKQATLVVPAYIYGKNLVIRKQQGEATPLWNDIKEVGREFKAATYDTGAEIGAFLGKSARKSIQASFNYGVRITKEAQKGNFVIDDDIKLLGKNVYKGVTNAADVTKRTALFVKENPVMAGIVVASAVSGTAEALWTKFKKDPVEVTISAFLLKGVKIPKVAAGTPVGRILLEEKFIRGQPKELRPFVRAIIKGAKAQEKLSPTKIKFLKKINFNVVRDLTKIEAAAVSKALKQTDSFIFGSLPARAISKGKTKIPKDVDLATADKKKFVKAFLDNLPKSVRNNYKIKGEKLLGPKGRELFDIKGYDRLRPEQSVFGTGNLPIYEAIAKKGKVISLKQSALSVPTQPLVEIGGIKAIGFGEQTTRKALGTLQVLIEKNPKRAKDPAAFVESLKIQLAALKGQIPKGRLGKILNYPKTLKANQLEKSIKLLESPAFSKALNKAVPGTTKEFPIVTKIKQLVKTNTKKINASVKSKLSKLKGKPKTAPKKAKKVSKKVSKPKTTKKVKKTPKKTPSKIPKSKIPKSRIPKSRIPKSKIPKSKVPKSKVPKSRTPSSKTPSSKTSTSKVPSSKTPTGKTLPSKTPPSKTPPSKTPPSKTPPSRIPPSRVPPTQTPPVRNITIPKFKNLKKGGRRIGYIIQIKDGNKIVGATTKLLPKNRAINLARRIVDKNARVSQQIVRKGYTDIEDVKTTILNQKFRAKKSKNPKVRAEVEKRKYRRDQPLEKKEISKKKKTTKSAPKKAKKVTKKVSKPKSTKKVKKTPKRVSKKRVVKKSSKKK